MQTGYLDHLRTVLADIEAQGLMKRERQITSPQGGQVTVAGAGGPRQMVNLCANNYLGLADHPAIADAATAALEQYGFGMASVRFICGTLDLHRELEAAIARYLKKDDAILFAACFDANGALFETLLTEDDAIISDSLNHASIIDGVRLSKAKRYRFQTSDMDDLETQLQQAVADKARFRLIVTDGVFSMDGYIAKLPEIRALADKYGAIIAVDDCHATGHLGPEGRGTGALTGAEPDIITGTFGKTLGGAMGGFITGPQAVIDLLRQRARPYLFSNALAPAVTAGSLKAIEIARAADDLRQKLADNTRTFRQRMGEFGFDLLPGETPIIPVMLGEATLAQKLAAALDRRGVYVAGFFFPVVPKGKARIRTQMSAALSAADIDFAIGAFAEAGKEVGVI
ncbi:MULTISPECIES: glycine C-acetyltransferase [unclassified Devosia]|uniref:glycine C-acetyltransferase n=1 Tax=unclassified Devosia TaxID=196773 RepID=UPI00086A8EF5|nr:MULTISPECIES: glycine C-acetyltransferase [unclassified Devosia]MBN9362394.1 glycine C-acetyltransferase [Devosia sp.]ODS94644.1 MAG: glycine C-acetyltransferase [Devosia sp. SCN 66-27]OJX24762.1 MAG: glycine C-acetyltransferase [Devosia sp. 66-14]